MAFDGPALRGTLEDPIVLHFSRSGDAARAVNLLTAYPNPFDDELVVHWTGDHPIEMLRMEDVRGRLVQLEEGQAFGSAGTARLLTQNLEDGVYLIRAWDGTQWYSVRVVK